MSKQHYLDKVQLNSETPYYNLVLDTPYVTVAEFSRRTGVPESTIRKYIKEGRISVIKKESSAQGKVLINMISETQNILQEENKKREENR